MGCLRVEFISVGYKKKRSPMYVFLLILIQFVCEFSTRHTFSRKVTAASLTFPHVIRCAIYEFETDIISVPQFAPKRGLLRVDHPVERRFGVVREISASLKCRDTHTWYIADVSGSDNGTPQYLGGTLLRTATSHGTVKRPRIPNRVWTWIERCIE